VLSGPLIGDVLSGRVAVRREVADGWATNTLTGEDFNNADNFKARAALVAHITDNLSASLILEHFEDDSSPMLFSLGRARPDQPSYAEVIGVPEYDREEREFQANNPSNRSVEGDKAILRVSWDLGPRTNLTSITGYITNTNSGQFGGGLIDSLAVFDYLETDVEQISQELTLTADITDRLDVIVGGLYLHSDAHEPLLFGTPSAGFPVDTFDFTADQELDSYAIYTQWRYRLNDSWRVTLGGRYTRDEKHYHEEDFFAGFPLPVVDAEESWEAFTPRVAIDYAPNTDLLFYASASRGFKAGGINAFATSDGTSDPYDPEFIWNYELGMRANWLDNRVRTSLTAFYMEYSDVQQNLRILNETTGVLLPNVVNASSATIQGVEAGIDANVTSRLRLRAAATWLDATYDDLHTNDLVYPELGERDFSGNSLARAPEWQYAVSGEYAIPLGGALEATLRADYQWQSQVYFSFYNHELNSQDDYGLLNLSAAIGPQDGEWRLVAFARNVEDTYYVTYAEANVSAGSPSLGGAVGQPRTYGLSIEYNF
jgi:iron complex outermembrane receptor protein